MQAFYYNMTYDKKYLMLYKSKKRADSGDGCVTVVGEKFDN